MKRIALIAPHFQEYALLLAVALAADAQVLLIIERGRLDSEFAGRDMPTAPNLAIADVDFTSVFAPFRLARALAGFRPAIIHIQEPSGLLRAVTCAASVFFFRPFCKLALTVHDPQPHAGRDTATERRLSRFRAFIRRNVHTVFVHGAFCRDQYQAIEAVAGPRIAMTEHGIILAGPPAATAEHGGPLRILSFGRMEQYKGVDILCEAAEQLERAGTNVALHIAGRGPELDRFQARFNALPHVEVRNAFIPARELIAAIQGAQCVVLPYLEATQSGVLAAAFANGRFVIASRVGGIPDVVEHMVNGILVEPGDAKALAAAIDLAAGTPDLRRKLQEGARQTALNRLDWNRIAKKLMKDY